MIECPTCGAMNEDADMTCRYCSRLLREDAAPTPNERFQAEPPHAPQPPPPYYPPQPPPQGGNWQQQPPPPGTGWQQPPPNGGTRQGYPQPPPPYGGYPAYPPQYRDINKIAAGIFGILLGSFGVHKFYMGKPGLGVVYLLFCWTGIPAIIGLVEGILYLTTEDEAFREKYARRF